MYSRQKYLPIIWLCGLIFLLVTEGFSLETTRGILRLNNDPQCFDNCDKYYIEPDAAYSFMYIRGNIEFYVNLHIEVSGNRVTCGGCVALNAQPNIIILPVVGVDEQGELPRSISLQQNYPNPFNPSTSIRYAVAEESFIKLSIYTLIGEEIESPVSTIQPPGYYRVDWSAGTRPSGVYFYRLSVQPRGKPEVVRTKTMVLAR